MKIFSAAQIYKADKLTIKNQQISSEALMERAATGLFQWLHERLRGTSVKIHLFCGIGNNGGDGIALARHLHEHGYNVHVHVVNYSEKRSKDFLINLERLKDRKIWPDFLSEKSTLPKIHESDIVIDAIFGIGLNREPEGWVAHLIKHINSSGAFTLSVDVPSGLYSDRVPENLEAVVESNYVLTIQAPKLSFFLPQTGIFVNQWEIVDIGLDPQYLEETETDYQFITKSDIVPLYIPREKFAHKGSFGHSVIMGGSYGKIGAVVLSTKASLNIGSGLVTAYIPECGYGVLQTAVPEAMVVTDDGDDHVKKIKIPFEPTVIGLGMGLGTETGTVHAISEFLEKNKTPLVIDADGINILAKQPGLLKKLPPQTILTPHEGELKRLLGTWKDDFDKLKKTMAFSKEHDCIVVVKGAHTIVIYNGKGYINSTGNPGIATAGSGDVLTGTLTGLLSQGYPALHAAIFGVFIHGLAGDIEASQKGYEAVTASSIINNIGNAFMALFSTKQEEEAPSGD
ncbi:bifunctional ADP-dependent NAD(P)H-hydrate dehydratase/NAD(P)H-hydrate epimerase [Flagellimonas lutaonensis]|uniref:Bifunctional NAD(P)H-hydrate repair enzyme n=1 Tax=Flagellimonas lutaonensis TaxID=516051 RepID=A0A0D5YVY1_9FLAO|nr:bifunctional ADP-dependent NAD(P)H-hydrate dehydratase/NAD(P)H-hydrate epimerase [Allomuricauda lutaonensis]AKA36029.1 YjeF-related protein [Allomuricauda lutaonensis]